MIHNRIFQRRGYRLRPLRILLRNVTRTAKEWGFPFAMRIQPELLRNYTLPHICDDEGYFLVGQLTLIIDGVLEGLLPPELVSYGKYLAFNFTLAAQHRRRNTVEIVELGVVIGPCDGRRPVVYVWRIEPLA